MKWFERKKQPKLEDYATLQDFLKVLLGEEMYKKLAAGRYGLYAYIHKPFNLEENPHLTDLYEWLCQLRKWNDTDSFYNILATYPTNTNFSLVPTHLTIQTFILEIRLNNGVELRYKVKSVSDLSVLRHEGWVWIDGVRELMFFQPLSYYWYLTSQEDFTTPLRPPFNLHDLTTLEVLKAE